MSSIRVLSSLTDIEYGQASLVYILQVAVVSALSVRLFIATPLM